MEFILNTLKVFPALLGAVPIVLQLAFGAMAVALVLGLLVALARISTIKVLGTVAVFFVEIIRGTPLLVQLVYIYFVLPAIGIDIDPIPAGIIGLGLNYGAYLSEVFRTAILSVEAGQTEAALSLGYTPTKALWRVVIPQSFVVSLGPIGNYFIAMVKDTALTSAIAVTEILPDDQHPEQPDLPNYRNLHRRSVVVPGYKLAALAHCGTSRTKGPLPWLTPSSCASRTFTRRSSSALSPPSGSASLDAAPRNGGWRF